MPLAVQVQSKLWGFFLSPADNWLALQLFQYITCIILTRLKVSVMLCGIFVGTYVKIT